MPKSDRWIRKMSKEHDMINPFSEKQVREGVISYGLSSYGYDLRVADEFKIFTNVNNALVDPKRFDEKSFVTVQTDICIVPPNSFALARSVEYFKIPRSVLTICVGKSTYARCGIIVNVTPFEPEWEGFVTLEISNTTPAPGAHLRQRRPLPDSLLRVRRSLRNQLRRPQRQIPGPEGNRPPEAVRKLLRAAGATTQIFLHVMVRRARALRATVRDESAAMP